MKMLITHLHLIVNTRNNQLHPVGLKGEIIRRIIRPRTPTSKTERIHSVHIRVACAIAPIVTIRTRTTSSPQDKIIRTPRGDTKINEIKLHPAGCCGDR